MIWTNNMQYDYHKLTSHNFLYNWRLCMGVSVCIPTEYNDSCLLYIMIQNSTIIYDYHKDWRRISSLIYVVYHYSHDKWYTTYINFVPILHSGCCSGHRKCVFRDRTRLNIIAVLERPVYEDTLMDFSSLPPAWYTLLRYFHIFCPCAYSCEDDQHNASILQSE